MSDYFKYFPKTSHAGRTAVDISRRSRILDDIKNDPFIYLPYTVERNDRPEDIARYYYGDANKVWLVYFANNIIDIYSQWPLSDDDFDNFIINKYSNKTGLVGLEVLAWAQNRTITDNILYYQNLENPDIEINTYTYENDKTIVGTEWQPIRVYDYEVIVNDNKRNIYLIDSRFANKFEDDLERQLNE